MKSLLYYLLQVIVASGILYGYYHLALRNKKFHRYNRYYLLAATVVSITIPFLNIPVYFTQSETDSSFVLQTLTLISSAAPGEVVHTIIKPEIPVSWWTWQNISLSFYILVASFVLLRIIFSLFKIRRIIKVNPAEQLDKIHFVNTSEPGTPFSFFRWLFWNKKIELQSEKGEQIFRHELFHIEQKHSSDIMYLELLTVLCWINPFFYLIKREVKAIHEFLADQFAVTENKKWEYAELLLMQSLNTQQPLVNPFFHNQIKRRITMITSSSKPGYHFFRKLMILPVIFLVLLLFAFKIKSYSAKTSKSDSPVKIVMNVSNNIIPPAIERYMPGADTSKPEMKQKSKKDESGNEVYRKHTGAEYEQREFKELMEEKQLEAEKSQQEFKQLMIEKELEAEKAQIEFKQLMEMKQLEAEKAQTEFKQLMMIKQQETENAQMEFKKVMENKQHEAAPEDQERFKQLMAEKQRESEKLQEEFKQRILKNQQETEKFRMEFNLLMEKTHREMENIQNEFKKNMLEKQREIEEKLKDSKKVKSF